jgi:UDP-glucose 4-epimerase
VREVLAAVEKEHGKPLKIVEGPRRAGDPPALVSKAIRVREVLGWTPKHDDLSVIVKSQLAWEQRLLREPALQKN